jgi:phage terminase large subunit-like protein
VSDLVRIVVAIDPAVSTGEDADETGIIVAGKDANGHGYVLADPSGPLCADRMGAHRYRAVPAAQGRPRCRRGQQRRRHG